jgi:hypothetical protein
VLLQQEGVINDILVWIGLLDDANRLALINNQTGTIIAMTHILLPFMILPLFSVMKTIPPSYVRAAKSLGATTGRRSGGSISRRRSPASAPARSSSSSCRSATTSRRNWSAARTRHLHLEPDRLPHLVVAQLGPGGGARVDPAGAGSGALLSTTRSSASIT